MTAAAFAAEELPLPTLREELRLLAGPTNAVGAPTWNIFDPVRNRYFRIGWAAFQLLSRWQAQDMKALVRRVNTETTAGVCAEDVAELVRFLFANSLTRHSAGGGIDDYLNQARAARPHWLKRALHHYLFFRLPLVRPEPLLRRLRPLANLVYSRSGAVVMSFATLLALYVVSRQWEVFWSTFLHLFSWEGLALYMAAQVAVKIVHELGHALMAARFGCRVPTMGVALMVLFPVLYTDTTDAWKLVSRRERLWIGAAGMLNELCVAVLATLAWSLLPDGPLRTAAFILATTSWVMSLVVNLNPCMRFDGYYLLSDWLGVENLQQRGFSMGRWKLREFLFGLGEPAPGREHPRLRAALVAYAWSTWVYRFFLFIGIALLVYHFAVKLLGVALFAVEISWFLGKPAASEIGAWWARRSRLRSSGRAWTSAAGALLLLALAFVPWDSRVRLPGVFTAGDQAWVFASETGRLIDVRVAAGDSVEPGDTLFRLESPALEHQIDTARRRREWLEIRARRQAASDAELAEIRVVLGQLQEEASRLAGLLERRERLVLRAPIAGVASDLADDLHPGRWIPHSLPLVFLAGNSSMIQAFAPEAELHRVSPQQEARFLPDDRARAALQGTVESVSPADIRSLDQPYLASTWGGPIAVRSDPFSSQLVPERSLYRVRIATPGESSPPQQAVRGIVQIRGEARSLAVRIFKIVAALLVRESGF